MPYARKEPPLELMYRYTLQAQSVLQEKRLKTVTEVEVAMKNDYMMHSLFTMTVVLIGDLAKYLPDRIVSNNKQIRWLDLYVVSILTQKYYEEIRESQVADLVINTVPVLQRVVIEEITRERRG